MLFDISLLQVFFFRMLQTCVMSATPMLEANYVMLADVSSLQIFFTHVTHTHDELYAYVSIPS